nr:hypothetical protein CTI12_AA086170 [Tanacetum cinerariifolium]
MAIASIWTNIANWSTPTILFCLLNLMIAIIFIASNFGNSHQDEHFDAPPDRDVVEDHNDTSDNSRYNNVSNVSGKASMKLAKRSTSRLTKSSSEKRVVESNNDDDADFDRRRPATVRESAGAKDECVNAKADDFIKRFKQQLKLQRLDSLQRFRDMLNRGT